MEPERAGAAPSSAATDHGHHPGARVLELPRDLVLELAPASHTQASSRRPRVSRPGDQPHDKRVKEAIPHSTEAGLSPSNDKHPLFSLPVDRLSATPRACRVTALHHEILQHKSGGKTNQLMMCSKARPPMLTLIARVPSPLLLLPAAYLP